MVISVPATFLAAVGRKNSIGVDMQPNDTHDAPVVGPENSCNPGQVVMMEPVNSREVDDMRRLGGTYRPMVGCIAGE